MGEAAALYESRLDSNPGLEPGAKLYRRKCLTALLKSWPKLASAALRKVSGEA